LGLEQDKREGIQQGIEQDIKQGELKAKLAIAKQLLAVLAVLDDKAICQITGLSIKAIAKLRNG
jgi:hypothetical protein